MSHYDANKVKTELVKQLEIHRNKIKIKTIYNGRGKYRYQKQQVGFDISIAQYNRILSYTKVFHRLYTSEITSCGLETAVSNYITSSLINFKKDLENHALEYKMDKFLK